MAHFDLCIIGSGSANSIPGRRLADLRIAMVDGAPYFSGTCLNVGCIPTKMFVYPADLARTPEHAGRVGVDLALDGVRWAEIRDRIFARIDRTAAAGERFRAEDPMITLYREHARFVAPKTLQLDSAGTITADRFVIGAGSRVVVPDIAGLADVGYYTSDTVMRLPRLPRSMIIVGGGYVAAEFAHIFAAYGTEVTVVQRSTTMLRAEDGEIAARFTQLLGRRVRLALETSPERVVPQCNGVRMQIRGPQGSSTIDAEVLLIATGRKPNADTLEVEAAGVELDDEGFVIVDEYLRTTAPDVFALGDVCSHHMLKHVANAEARVVQHNLVYPDDLVKVDNRFIPHAVFSEPQVASVGLTSEQAAEQGRPVETAIVAYGQTAYGWAMEDTEHIVKVLGDPRTGLLLGAHIIGPQASSLIQPLIQAMTFGLSARAMARQQYWIHPAMAEVVENAVLELSRKLPRV